MSDQAISMEEPKLKLARLKNFIPNATNNLVYNFGPFLVDYLNPKLEPMGFIVGCEPALYDLQAGVNGFTGLPIQSRLVGYPPMIYVLLRMEIPTIAEAIFPAEFAASVNDHFERINAKMQAARSEQSV